MFGRRYEGRGGDAASADDWASSDASETAGAQTRAFFGGEITYDHRDGHFDVLYDDGTRERRVPRPRISHEDPGEWSRAARYTQPPRIDRRSTSAQRTYVPRRSLVYVGPENKYAVEAVVPDSLVKSEPGINVECLFELRTSGTEYGWDRLTGTVAPSPETSLPSPVAAFRTRGAPAAPPSPTGGREFQAIGAGRHFV